MGGRQANPTSSKRKGKKTMSNRSLGLILIVGALFMFYAGYHTRVVLDEAALAKQQTKVIDSIPQVITKTQTITKVIHDAAPTNACVNAPMPAALLEQLR